MTETPEAVRWRELAVLVTILLVAIALRTWRLADVPPGLTHDEASNGHDAAAILHGIRPIYFTVGYGHEPLYPYSVALSMALFGPTDLTLRLTTAVWGSCLILLSYLLARRLLGALPALITAAWMAVSFWCVMTSRVGLRAVTAATTFTASAYAFWRALPLSSGRLEEESWDSSSPFAGGAWVWWTISGLFLGVSIYTYMAIRAMPAVYVLFVAYLMALRFFGRLQRNETRSALEERQVVGGDNAGGIWKQQMCGVAALLLIAAIVAAPLIHFLITHPEAEQRLSQLSGPIRDALHGNFEGLWYRVSRSLPMFTIRGDPLWLYNIPGRPLLDVVGGAFFYAGLTAVLWRWRDPRYAFLSLWLIVGVGPALVTGPDATTLRSITAQPAIFIIASVGLTIIVRFLLRHAARWGRVAIAVTVVALLVVTGVRTAHAYFGIWAKDPNVRVAYHHALVQQAHYLDSQSANGAVAVSSIYPGRYHDPYTMEITLHRDDLSMRWFDGRHSLVFPVDGASRVIVPSIAPLDEELLPIFVPYASLIHTERFRPDDLITRFDVYQFNADDALATILSTTSQNPVFWSSSDAFPPDYPRSAYEPLDLPVNVGGVVELIGYDLLTPSVRPGDEIGLLTVWRVRDTVAQAPDSSFSSELVMFTHALGTAGNVVGQRDQLDVPSWHWQAGDCFVQLHRFPVDSALIAGQYSLEVGFYTGETLSRLPILVDDAPIDDRILIRPFKVTSQ